MTTPVFGRRDRIELSLLALLVLGWAFVLAPSVHQLEHEHQHSHGGATPASSSHGAGSLEHHQLALNSPVPTPEMLLVLIACAETEPLVPTAPDLIAHRPESSPQAP